MRVRLLPWRPRFRDPSVDPSGALDSIDDIGIGLALLVGLLLLPIVACLVLFSLEIALLAALVPLLMAGQLLGLLPWVLSVTELNGTKRHLEVRGTRRMLAERRRLRALVA